MKEENSSAIPLVPVVKGLNSSLSQDKTIQDYIDETPAWADGTPVTSAPLTAMQWRIWGLATTGKFFEGLVVFMTGVALPLIVEEFSLNDVQKGMVSAAPLMGILIGATALGGLSDHFGRKRMFILEMVLFAVGLAFLVFTHGLTMLLICLFGIGAALGCDYPTAHLIISESIPSSNRGKLVLSAFGFQAVGALAGTAIGYMILAGDPEVRAWRWMYGTAILPAILVTLGRLTITDSGPWLASKGLIEKAERETLRLLKRNPPYPSNITISRPDAAACSGKANGSNGYAELFNSKNRKATILASIPWFIQDLGTYGVGIFTPTILATVVGAESGKARNLADIIHQDLLAAKGAAFLDLLLLVGIVVAVLLVERAGRIRLQLVGFFGCAMGLAMVAVSLGVSENSRMIWLFSGFMLFNFMTNMGPNAMTYLIAGEVFPTCVRGKGMGLAASVAKLGAVATAFLFPILLADIGTTALLLGLTVTSLLGAAITWGFRIETTGVNLDRIGE